MRARGGWICLGLIVANLAYADPKADGRAAAKAHFEKGSIAFDLHHYDEAAAEYEAAYQAKPDPALLYNLGQALRLGGKYELARSAYQSFLRRMPQSPQRAEVEQLIEETRVAEKQEQERAERDRLAAEKAAEQKAAEDARRRRDEPRPTSATITREQPVRHDETAGRWRTLKWAGLGIGVGGVVLGIAGAAIYVSGQAAFNKIDRPPAGYVFDPDDERRMNTLRPTGVALLSIGVAAAAAGFALFGVSHTKERAARRHDGMTSLPATGASFVSLEAQP